MPLAGALYAFLAYGTWGLLPVYWKALAGVPVGEVLAHRVAGTVVFSVLLLAALGRTPELGEALVSRGMPQHRQTARLGGHRGRALSGVKAESS